MEKLLAKIVVVAIAFVVTCAYPGWPCTSDSDCEAINGELCLQATPGVKKCIICECEERDQCDVNHGPGNGFIPTASCDCTGYPNTAQPKCKPNCAHDPDPCGNNTDCTDSGGSTEAVCTCMSGYTGDPSCCTDINECDDGEGTHQCENGECMNTDGSYDCNCDSGWSGDLCDVDVDECDGSPCLNGASCTNNLGSYSCSCSGETVGVNCEALCNFVPDPCGSNTDCTDGNGASAAACACKTGFQGDPYSSSGCDDINECDNSPCQNGAPCGNTPGSYSCTCGSNELAPLCEALCGHSTATCAANADCEDYGQTSEFICECPDGYESDDPYTIPCTNIDECTSIEQPCGTMACVDSDPGYCCS